MSGVNPSARTAYTIPAQTNRATFAFVHAALVAGGVFYALAGAALLFAPEWFYQAAATFPPFNRHFAGDLGTFNLPLGLLLIWAARTPAQHRSLLLLAVMVSWLHALNHLYDDFITRAGLVSPLFSSVSLLIFALVLTIAYWLSFRISSAARR